MPHRLLGLLLAPVLVAACSSSPAATPAATRVNFELDCDSSDTALASRLFCVRTDTRNGDIKVVDYEALPRSGGATSTAEPDSPGRYTTVCDSTATDRTSDFYCIRLDVETGEMLLVNLTKLATIPDDGRPVP